MRRNRPDKANAGTVEALEEALTGIQVVDEVVLRVIDRGVGGHYRNQRQSGVGFRCGDHRSFPQCARAEGKATELASREGVEIRYYSVIYQAIDHRRCGAARPACRRSTRNQCCRLRSGVVPSSKVGLLLFGRLRNAKARLPGTTSWSPRT